MAVLLLCGGVAFGQNNDVQKAVSEAAAAIAATQEQKAAEAKPKYWTNSLGLDLGFSNICLVNWSAGGYNTITVKAALDGKANYKKNLTTWNNRIQAEYGFLHSADKPGLLQHSNDRLYVESKFAAQTSKKSKWKYTVSFDFKSQFANGYTYKTPAEGQSWLDAAVLKSGFISPAYTNVAIGIEWDPNDLIDVSFAPLTGGFTICEIESLRKTYGMELKDEYAQHSEIEGYMYRSARFQFGAQVKANLKFTLNDNFKFESQLVLFSDYLNKPQEIRVNWDNKIDWQIAKYFKIGLSTWLIYDPNVLIDDEHKVQFKESLSINFTYTIKSK